MGVRLVLRSRNNDYSRLIGADEEGTLIRLNAVRKTIVDPLIATQSRYQSKGENGFPAKGLDNDPYLRVIW
jgi:hypothetical protein